MTGFSEPDHKITRKIARAKAAHMSNTKWRKLLPRCMSFLTGL